MPNDQSGDFRQDREEILALIRAASERGFTRAKPPGRMNTAFVPAGLTPDTPGAGAQPSEAVPATSGPEAAAPAPRPTPAPPEAPPAAPPPPPRPAEADLAAAREEGRSEGHAAGMAEGIARGRTEAHAELEQTAAALSAALEALSSPGPEALAPLSAAIDEAVRRLAAERAGQAIDAAPAPFLGRVAALVDRVGQGMRAATVHLHPDDLAAISPLLPGPPALADAHLRADASLARGDVEVRAPGIHLSDRLDAEEAV